MFKIRYPHIYLFVLIITWLGLYLDGLHQAHQTYTSIIVIMAFTWVYYFASKPIKQLMLFGLIVALMGEIVFALILGMYTYRLDNIPIYVPFGHALIYASVYYLVKEPLVLKHKEKITVFLYYSMILYSTLWLIFADDVLGFICMLVILILFKCYPNTKLFFLFMFFFVVYLELLGTYYGCWSWPPIWFDKFSLFSSANPPSGISVFYFGFDAGCLWFYKHYNKERWRRIKRLRVRG